LTPLKQALPHILLFLVLAFFLGRFWCGWLCPLGFISDVLGIVRKYLRLTYFNLPEVFQNFLTKFKYGFLVLIGLISLAIALPVLAVFQKELFLVGCQTCPARVLFPLLGGQIPTFYSFDSPILIFFSLVGIIFLIIFLMSFFIRRFWCRICPSGALISFFNLGGAITKEKDVQKCTKCGICQRVCLVQNKNVYEEKIQKNVNNRECIQCLRCVDLCPEERCLKIKFLGKKLFKSKYVQKIKKLIKESNYQEKEEEKRYSLKIVLKPEKKKELWEIFLEVSKENTQLMEKTANRTKSIQYYDQIILTDKRIREIENFERDSGKVIGTFCNLEEFAIVVADELCSGTQQFYNPVEVDEWTSVKIMPAL
jgi:ferredoxin